jgi:hypothetical protein
MNNIQKLQRSDFYNELSEDKKLEYFGKTEKKFLAAIDNIYYNAYIEDDINNNIRLKHLIERLADLKEEVRATRQAVTYNISTSRLNNDWDLEQISLDVPVLYVVPGGDKNFRYCVSNPDLYDIFIADHLPTRDNPRVLVQLRAYGLWMYGTEKMLQDSLKAVQSIFGEFYCEVSQCMENRIDYCFHTNIITNIEKTLSERNLNAHVYSTLKKYEVVGRREDKKDHIKGYSIHRKDYLCYGRRKSDNVEVKIYNKTLEVIEQGYKCFFFEYWYNAGLISFYDKYCMEAAYKEKNYNLIHKAKLQFYLEYGTDERVKREFELILNDVNSTLDDFKNAAKSYMPAVTQIMNIEFETRRKFYRGSDKFINDVLKMKDRGEHSPLNHVYKIIDNRSVFLEYLSRVTFSFRRKEKPKNKQAEVVEASPMRGGVESAERKTNLEDIYCDWWRRLRGTKLDGFPVNERLIREYTKNLDEKAVQRRIIGSIATVSVYGGNIDNDFVDDVTELLSNLNDNDIQRLRASIKFKKDGGETKEVNEENEAEIKFVPGAELNSYDFKKQVRYKRLKNRIEPYNQQIRKMDNMKNGSRSTEEPTAEKD